MNFQEQKSGVIKKLQEGISTPVQRRSVLNRAILKHKARLVVMASGQGTLFEAIARACQTGFSAEKLQAPSLKEKGLFEDVRRVPRSFEEDQTTDGFCLKARVISLVSDNAKAAVIQKAGFYKIPVRVISAVDCGSFSEWDKKMLSVLNRDQPDLIILAGFVKKIGPRVLKMFENRIINSHPALLPRYGGKGMYGTHVHRAVVEAGDSYTGVSVHLVREDYDTGPVLAQKKIPVSEGEIFKSLQGKVKKVERRFYVSVIQKVLEGTSVE